MIPVEPAVNRSLLKRSMPCPWPGRVLSPTRRKPASINRHQSIGDAMQQRVQMHNMHQRVQMQNLPSGECQFASVAYRATFSERIAAGFVRRKLLFVEVG